MPLVKCPRCGTDTSDRQDTCYYCGASLSQPPPPQTKGVVPPALPLRSEQVQSTPPTQASAAKRALAVLGSIVMFVVLVIAMGVGKLIGRSAVQSLNGPDVEATLAAASREANRSLPQMVDNDTRLDTTVAGPGMLFSYYYTFPALASTEVDRALVQANLYKTLQRNVCGSAAMKPMLQARVAAVYVYRANDGVEVGRLTVRQSDCDRMVADPSAQDVLNALASADESQPSASPVVPTAEAAPVAAEAAAAVEPSPQRGQAQAPYNAGQQACNDEYQRTIADVPPETSLGAFAEINSRAETKRAACVKARQ